MDNNKFDAIAETSDCIYSIAKIMDLDLSKESLQALGMILAEVQELQYRAIMGDCKTDNKSSESPNLKAKASQIQPKASETEKTETKHFIEVLPEDNVEDLKSKARRIFENRDISAPVMFTIKLVIVADLENIGLSSDSQTAAFLKNMCRLKVSNHSIALDNPYSVEWALNDQLKLNFSAKRVTQEIRDAHPDLSKSELIGFEDYVIGSMSALDILGSYTELIGEYLKLAGK
jgi:hypothetical protein